MNGLWAVLRKETLQMARDRATLFFALLIPVFQLVLFGTIDTTVERVPTVVLDQSRTQESRALLDDLVNTSIRNVAISNPAKPTLPYACTDPDCTHRSPSPTRRVTYPLPLTALSMMFVSTH